MGGHHDKLRYEAETHTHTHTHRERDRMLHKRGACELGISRIRCSSRQIRGCLTSHSPAVYRRAMHACVVMTCVYTHTQVSPPMSTYLMAWVVGNLAKTSHPGCITNTGGSGVSFTTVPIAAYATPSK